jgi:hypothetical protein
MGLLTVTPPATPPVILPTLPMPRAAVYVGKHYETLRGLVRDGVFSRIIQSTAKKRPHVNLLVVELDAFRVGGVEAVRRLRSQPAKRAVKTVAGA